MLRDLLLCLCGLVSANQACSKAFTADQPDQFQLSGWFVFKIEVLIFSEEKREMRFWAVELITPLSVEYVEPAAC